jgi:UDP-galactopyranose mutase
MPLMDVLVTSHLRWNFVFQRPQHLMSRFARDNRVFFWEEPVPSASNAFLDVTEPLTNLYLLVPHLPPSLTENETCLVQERLLAELMEQQDIDDYVLWYYTPMAMHFTRNLNPTVVVYDCMDELSGFRGAPPGLRAAEAQLFRRADLIFTGGKSLYEAKCKQHSSVYCFPSSIDREFFARARSVVREPEDQSLIPRPRLGYAGVIDERMDVDLLRSFSTARPDWHFVMLGPVVKIQESELPQGPNIHYLGAKKYSDLPAYLAGWEVGMMPFAKNESTRFISPTKTPEYLAAGLPVVSTSIVDVVSQYGQSGLVHIADNCKDFVAAAEKAIQERNCEARVARADKFLQQNSWDTTWAQMAEVIASVAMARKGVSDAEEQTVSNYASVQQ